MYSIQFKAHSTNVWLFTTGVYVCGISSAELSTWHLKVCALEIADGFGKHVVLQNDLGEGAVIGFIADANINTHQEVGLTAQVVYNVTKETNLFVTVMSTYNPEQNLSLFLDKSYVFWHVLHPPQLINSSKAERISLP